VSVGLLKNWQLRKLKRTTSGERSLSILERRFAAEKFHYQDLLLQVLGKVDRHSDPSARVT
jgi:hypothetical protein